MGEDAYIIAVGRALLAKGVVLRFDEAIIDGDAIKVGVSISTVVEINGSETVAHGRRLALMALVET